MGKGLSKRMKRGCKKEVIIYEKGNRNDLGLRKSMQNMKRFYNEMGYAHSKITYRDTTYIRRKKQKRMVTFLIDEDSLTNVVAFDVKGNRAFDIKKRGNLEH